MGMRFGMVIGSLGTLALGAAILPSAASAKRVQETPSLPAPVLEELQDSIFMDGVLELLRNQRPRLEMHAYLTEEMGEFFFLLTQPAGQMTIDEFRPTNSAAVQSLMLTMDLQAESLSMVHMLLAPEASPMAEGFIEGAFQSADQGGPQETKLYLLGVHDVDGEQFQVMLRQETSSTGAPLYWVHFF